MLGAGNSPAFFIPMLEQEASDHKSHNHADAKYMEVLFFFTVLHIVIYADSRMSENIVQAMSKSRLDIKVA